MGVGSLPDAADYGDQGANTLGHVAERCGGLELPNLEKLGLGNILPILGVAAVPAPLASWGRMAEQSLGKDTIAGHWELMGIILDQAFALFPQGFPGKLVDDFKRLTGVGAILGNKAASGTEIIAELGAGHLASGFPIVYTSADSVLQIAAHEEILPLPQLYEMCLRARKLCDEWRIGRVIARPFVGSPGHFSRTANRRDFPMQPPQETVLDVLLPKRPGSHRHRQDRKYLRRPRYRPLAAQPLEFRGHGPAGRRTGVNAPRLGFCQPGRF